MSTEKSGAKLRKGARKRAEAAALPEPELAPFERAAALEAEGDDVAAMNAYRELLAAEPGHLRARIRLGTLLERAGELEQALEQFEAARVAAPDDVDVL